MMKKTPRPRTLNRTALSRLATAERAEVEALLREYGGHKRPKTRGECGTARPCPFVSCKYHLYLDVNPETGAVKLNHPGKEVCELTESCALDLAERGVTLEEAGAAVGVTRERARQIEAAGLAKLRVEKATVALQVYLEP
jgi:hypothetical protein